MANKKNQFGLGSYNPASGFLVQPNQISYDDPILSGGASTMTGSSMSDALLNRIRNAAGLGTINRKTAVPTQESGSGIVDAIRNASLGTLFQTDPALKAALDARSRVSPFQESDEAFDLSTRDLDIFSPDAAAGIAGQRMPLTGGGDQPGDATFGGRIPEDIDAGDDLVGTGDVTTGAGTVEPRLEDADAADTGIRTRSEDLDAFVAEGVTGSGKTEGTAKGGSTDANNPAFDLMSSALESYNAAVGRAPSGAKSMAEYKKEFSEATGIDISGDPDNKAALTAFGLALMQNKAGKGFNVGNILSEVGAAGEKALPLMEAARKEARQGQLAAGQYALQQAQSADAARQKFLVDQSDYLRNRQDKVLDYMQTRRDTLVDDAAKRDHDLQLEAVKHGFKLKQKEIQSQIDAAKDDKYDKIETYQLLPNITALKVQRGFDGKKPVYADPGTTGMQVAETYKDVQVKLAMVDDLENILTTLANEGDKAFGGQVGKIIFDRVNKYSKLVGGPYADVFNKRGLTPESEAEVLIDAFVQANKRFISQETGNGVSDGDKKDIRTVAGEVSLTDSLDKNLARLDQVRSLFSKNVGLLENEIIRLGDRTEFSDDSSYEKTQKIVSDILTPVDILGTTSFDVRS